MHLFERRILQFVLAAACFDSIILILSLECKYRRQTNKIWIWFVVRHEVHSTSTHCLHIAGW